MLTFIKIKQLQKLHGYTEIQEQINSGQIWKFEGSVGKNAMNLLESGACMLPKKFTFDYYGNQLPSRDVLKAGTKGTFKNSQNFWQKVVDGEIDLD